MSSFPFYKQLDAMDCGPTCLRMVASFYGKEYSLEELRALSHAGRTGVSLMGVSEAAEQIGLRSIGVSVTLNELKEQVPLPAIIHWGQNHFVVLYKIKNDKYWIANPAVGLEKYKKEDFLKKWAGTIKKNEESGICLALEPGADFYEKESSIKSRHGTKGFRFLLSYLKNYKSYFVQLLLGMLAGSILQLTFPFLTQAIVDYGIRLSDIHFINLILLGQLILFVSLMSVDVIRGWILLHVSTRVNVSLISDFLRKLMKLPVAFFDTKLMGDIIQRINDHKRVESFLTTSSIEILFSSFNLIVFGFVLAIYNWIIFGVFVAGSALYALWLFLFMEKRKQLDWQRFSNQAKNQSAIIQLVNGMQEIRLNNCEQQKRWEWEDLQAGLFQINKKSLALRQYQNAGGVFINGLKNIFITFIAAKAVIDGSMTLGMMLAVQFILGQLNSPIRQLLSFFNSAQDAKISLERIGEIHNQKNEENPVESLSAFSGGTTFRIKNLHFQYEGPSSPMVINHIDLEIPEGKTTAIVGVSGSGKTTLIKLLLAIYDPVEGSIELGSQPLSQYNKPWYRSRCGVVMQDGFIFSDTIASNIAPGIEKIDKQTLAEALRIANLEDLVESLPLGVNTKIGQEGQGLSQGQKQRILIARAVYKNPDLLFLDEATNALDANNEKAIMENLTRFCKNKTSVVVAHRLSTVKNADQIIVIDKGRIIETGTHHELSSKKGAYYQLVKNQLELGM